jgi:hypothetical protein
VKNRAGIQTKCIYKISQMRQESVLNMKRNMKEEASSTEGRSHEKIHLQKLGMENKIERKNSGDS